MMQETRALWANGPAKEIPATGAWCPEDESDALSEEG
jgi:hypothetical protein